MALLLCSCGTSYTVHHTGSVKADIFIHITEATCGSYNVLSAGGTKWLVSSTDFTKWIPLSRGENVVGDCRICLNRHYEIKPCEE